MPTRDLRERKQPLRVLHISRRFHPLTGGTERHIAEITTRMRDHGVDPRVLTLRRDVSVTSEERVLPARGEFNGIPIIRVPSVGPAKKPIPLRVPLASFRWADVVHIHDVRLFYETAMALKPLLGYRIVVSTHGFLFHTTDLHLVKRVLTPLYYLPTLRRVVDTVISVSHQDHRFFAGRGLPNVRLVTNGVDVKKFSSVRRRPEEGRILYFGRIDHNKGLDLLLESLKRVEDEDWRLDVVGEGPSQVVSELQALTSRLGESGRVRWHGALTDKELLEFLGRASLCVFPSTYEGFGLTLLEAMAAGCPCVVNGIPAYLENVRGNGVDAWVVDFSSPAGAAARLSTLLRSPSSTRGIEAEARTTAARFDWGAKVQDIVALYHGLS